MAQHGAVVAVLEVGPDAALRFVRCGEKGKRVGPVDGAAGEVGDEAGAEEDGEDAEVLGGVVDGDLGVPCAERVLDAARRASTPCGLPSNGCVLLV